MSLTPLDLGSVRTPVERADRLGVALGLRPGDLLVKRDDLLGPGGGGNKVRKLEWTCAEALAAGADTLVTTGAAQSNHARLTAAAGARLGLRVVLVLAGHPRDEAHGNLLLDALFGARLVWAGDVDGPGLREVASHVAAELERDGATPYVVPFGGSSPSSIRGYAAVRDRDVRPGQRTVFVHTGGLPGLFGHEEARSRLGALVRRE